MNKEKLIEKIKEIQKGITLVKNECVFEQGLVLDYITIFAHSDDEFNKLVKVSEEIGEKIEEHNGPVFKLKEYLKFDNGVLKIFRIRKPDIERPQIGCGDFKVFDYEMFKSKYLNKKNFVLFQGKGFEFLGIHDLTKDYLVYFPDKCFSEELII